MEEQPAKASQASTADIAATPDRAARATTWRGRGVRWPWAAFLVGAIWCLCWQVALLIDTAPVVDNQRLAVCSVLILAIPIMVTLFGARRGGWRGLPLTLLLVMLGALPMLLTLKMGSASNSSEIWIIALLPPGMSIGAALAFAWPVNGTAGSTTEMRTAARGVAALGGLGYAAMLVAIAIFEQVAIYTFLNPCPGKACVLGYVIFAFLGLMQFFAALFGLLLAMLGGWLGSLARGLGAAPR